MNESFVRVWQEEVVIPTYGTGAPDKNPMFFEKRVYQGSSGVVYPHPVIEKIENEKKDHSYTGLFLENEYVKIMVLPELGGRVQLAYDKIGGRPFIYYNQVIKPALVGLCGPWISGGIEFNWPQHHRPGTFDPVDYTLEENEDGSKTIWVNEVEQMFHTKGMAGFTLRPGKAYLEIKVKLFNRTPLPQTFLWWANPALKVNDHYQSVFPPDVNAVFDHGKRDVSSFPIARGTYYKVDYSPGTDISRYKNIPVPTSYMAIHSDYDFVGGYEHDTQAGMLHVADHHISPGKKQWTWGCGDFGKAWDRNLTDEDGPYVEIMTGVYTDNQPDFSWLMPYEEKSFTQYFLPYRALGLVKNATKDLLVNVEKTDGQLSVKVFATSRQKGHTIRVWYQDWLLVEDMSELSPERIYSTSIPVNPEVTAENILVTITGADGRERLRYEPAANRQPAFPEPARAPLPPGEVASNEQLFLTGLHLEQYRHATYSPLPYYEEALRRDPGDIRNNNALGLWYLRRGQFARSEAFFRKAIHTLTQRNANPYDGEPYYNLGLSLQYQDRIHEAYDAFYKACWNSAWQESAYFSLAQIDLAGGDWQSAIGHIERSLEKNACNGKAWLLKIVALRKSGRPEAALEACAEALQKDVFNLPVYFEKYRLLAGKKEAAASLQQAKTLARGYVQNYIEYALDYQAAGLYEEAIECLQLYTAEAGDSVYPMLWYYLACWHRRLGLDKEAKTFFRKAAAPYAGICFPNRPEDIAVLREASAANAADARASYYLGNLWYDKKQYAEAMAQWELSAQRDPGFPTVFRNLGIASFNKKKDAEKARQYYEEAFALDTTDARVLMELDQLYKRINHPAAARLAFLEQHRQLVEQRDDLYLERIALYNFSGDHEKAFELIMQRRFHPWEGGEGKVSGQYLYSLVEMARQAIGEGRFEQAVEWLQQAQAYPENLGEGKLFGAQENDIFYWLGVAYEQLSQPAEATVCFERATHGLSEPAAALFYNDQPPDKIFYQGLAWKKLGKEDKAAQIFDGLIRYGQTHLEDEVTIDYFAVSLPNLLIFEDDLASRHRIHCRYVTALGYLGLGKSGEATRLLEQVLEQDATHFGALTHLNLAKELPRQAGLLTI